MPQRNQLIPEMVNAIKATVDRPILRGSAVAYIKAGEKYRVPEDIPARQASKLIWMGWAVEIKIKKGKEHK